MMGAVLQRAAAKRQKPNIASETTMPSKLESVPPQEHQLQAEQSQITKPQTISFLDIPPEIRDMIYKLSCTPESIKTIPKLPLASVTLTGETLPWERTLMPVFMGLCQQTRMECTPLLLHTALSHTCPISFTIIDFDFRPVIEFFKRLSPSDRETVTRHASFKVCLEVHRTPDLERLYKWLQFQADKRMEGARWTYHLLHPYWGEDP